MNIKTVSIILVAVGFVGFSFFWYKKSRQEQQCNVSDQECLRVGTAADYPPYTFIDIKTNTIVGFDIDIINEVARRMNKKISLKDMPFDSLVFELLSESIDVIAAGMSPTEKRKEMIAFSDNYLKGGSFVVVTHKDAQGMDSIEGLKHKKIAVNIGYNTEAYLAEYPEIDLVRLPSPSDGLMALQTGAVDGYVGGKAVVDTIIRTSFKDQFKTHILGTIGDGCALAFNKKSTQLIHEINEVINKMMEDGTVEALKAKWNIS